MHSPTRGTPVPTRWEVVPVRSQFIANAELQFGTWQRMLDHLGEKLRVLPPDSRVVLRRRMKELRNKLVEAGDRLEALKQASSADWVEAKTLFEITWDQILEILNRTDPPGLGRQ